jgi:hypothetical protein
MIQIGDQGATNYIGVVVTNWAVFGLLRYAA